MTAYDLKNIASAGGNIVVNAEDFSAYDLKNIAENGVATKAKLTIKNAGGLSGYDCKNIASANPGNVTFDLANKSQTYWEWEWDLFKCITAT